VAKLIQPPHRGRVVLLFRTTPATILTIAHTGATLRFGQERSKVKTALTAGPCRAPHCSCTTQASSRSRSFWTESFAAASGQQIYAFVWAVIYAYWFEKSPSLLPSIVGHNVGNFVEDAIVLLAGMALVTGWPQPAGKIS
jgi:hypothetical protein